MTKMIKVKVNFDRAKIIMAMNTETHNYIHYLPDEDEMASLFLVDRANFVDLIEHTDESQLVESLEFFDKFAREPEDIQDGEKLSVYDIHSDLTYVYAVTESFFDSADKELSKVVFISLNEEKAREFKNKQKGHMFSVEIMTLDSAIVEY